VPSAFLFDIGVFVLVVGATALFLVSLAHQSLRAHRVEAETNRADPVADPISETAGSVRGR